MNKVAEVFWQFLILGCVSFGGPAAHIGYFQTTFVQKLKWLDESSYARLISLSQFLPGPGSSQIGFAIGLRRAGIFGGIAAFIGFTLPSFILMCFIAIASTDLSSNSLISGVIHGLKLLAVVVVADATYNMFQAFCKEKLSISIAVFNAIFLLCIPSLSIQIFALIAAAIVGAFYGTPVITVSNSKNRLKLLPLILFISFLVILPFVTVMPAPLNIFADFYQAGSLVFGGGHVVLPLLQQTIGDAISTDRFLLGYATAQAVPGPMFTLAAFLGAELSQPHQILAALMATVGIFLPGLLLVLSLQGVWETLASRPKVAGATLGINAAVVGLLFSALFDPIFISAVSTPIDMALVVLGLFAMKIIRMPILLMVISFGICGVMVQFYNG
jgi:chromate transporter